MLVFVKLLRKLDQFLDWIEGKPPADEDFPLMGRLEFWFFQTRLRIAIWWAKLTGKL